MGGTGLQVLLRGFSSIARFTIRTLLFPADFESVKGNTEPCLNSAGLQDMYDLKIIVVPILIINFLFHLFLKVAVDRSRCSVRP